MQNGEDIQPPAALIESREKTTVLLLCVLAAFHVLVFSAAFPFFNNVDEGIHFDLVVKYSQGRVPQGKELVSPESAAWLAQMNSHAYLGTPDQNGQLPPPPWTLSAGAQQRALAARSASWRAQQNYEVTQAPLYYALAGFWWDVGQWIGLSDGRLLYWLRFLNVLPVVAAVWLAYATMRVVFFDNIFMRIGVPALLAFMPQTAFYSLGNDVLSPTCFGATFLCLVKWLRNPSASIGGLTGLAFAATYLAKISNLPLLLVVVVVAVMKTCEPAERSVSPRLHGSIDRVFLLFDSADCRLDGLVPNKLRRFNRLDDKDRFSRLDDQAVQSMVASSNFPAPGFLDVFVGATGNALAGGILVASYADGPAVDGCHLHGSFLGLDWRGRAGAMATIFHGPFATLCAAGKPGVFSGDAGIFCGAIGHL